MTPPGFHNGHHKMCFGKKAEPAVAFGRDETQSRHKSVSHNGREAQMPTDKPKAPPCLPLSPGLSMCCVSHYSVLFMAITGPGCVHSMVSTCLPWSMGQNKSLSPFCLHFQKRSSFRERHYSPGTNNRRTISPTLLCEKCR